MSKKLVDGQEFFDGQVVELYQGRFSGPFYMSDQAGLEASTDDLVTFVVTARVESPKFSYVKKTGELMRSNTMKVQDAFMVDANEAKYILDNMGQLVEGVNEGVIEAPSEDEGIQSQETFEDWDV